jgi:4-hydroxybenzoate polyprenyltransferase
VLIGLSISHFLLVQPIHNQMGLQNNLDLTGFALLVLSVLFIMAGGYVINDYFDDETDIENNRFNLISIIGRKKTLLIYSVLSFTGLVYGLWLAYRLDAMPLWSVHILAVLLLFLYSSKLKSMPMAGNLLVAILCGIIPLLPIIFENKSIEHQFHPAYFILNFLALLAFLSTLIRELIKDMEDIEGDEKTGVLTLPVVIGLAGSKSLVIIFFSMFILLLISVIWFMTAGDLISQLYLSIGLLIPSLLLLIKLMRVDDSKGFHLISSGLKALMLIGLFYGVIYYYIYL